MEARIVKQVEPFSNEELEILEFLPEKLKSIEVELIPSLESLPPEKVAKNLEVYFEGFVGAAGTAVALGQLGVELGKTIASAVNSSRNRSGFVKNLSNSAYYATRKRYNVMVCNLSLNYIEQLNGVKFYQSAVYSGVTYGIWVFESGQFTNKGDGGFINWSFMGRFQRNGNSVRFSKP